MKKILFYLFMSIVSFFLFQFIKHSNVTANEKDVIFYLPSKEYDLGVITEGEIIQHTFSVVNNGGGKLDINLRPSCNCTKATISKNPIASGKTGNITVFLDTTGREGYFEQSVLLTTNDPKNKSVRVKLHVDVLREVEISPDRLWLGEAPRNATFEQEITFSKRNDKKFDIKSIEVPVGVEYEFGQKSINNGITQIPVRFTINTGDSLGNFQRNIVVETERSKKKEHKIEISGVILPVLKVIPTQITIPNAKPGSVVEKEIRVSPVKKTIASITAQAGNKNVAIGEMRRDQEQYILPLKITVPVNATSLQDTIKVYYDGRKDTDIVVPVRVNAVTAVTMK
jgi:hypothetical protein